MKGKKILASGVATIVAAMALATSSEAATTVQIGTSGKTFASSAVSCAANPTTGLSSPVVDAGLFNPKRGASASVSLNGDVVAAVTAADPSANVWLADGNNTVGVALNKKTADSYTFAVPPGMCELPDTTANTFSADGTLEYAASGKSYATVTPGCALNGKTGQVQPYVNLFDNGNYLLNVSVNDVPLTQLSATRPHTPVFLGAGQNVISAANGYLSVDYYVRDGGDGTCTLP
jgi:streptogramin lyase